MTETVKKYTVVVYDRKTREKLGYLMVDGKATRDAARGLSLPKGKATAIVEAMNSGPAFIAELQEI